MTRSGKPNMIRFVRANGNRTPTKDFCFRPRAAPMVVAMGVALFLVGVVLSSCSGDPASLRPLLSADAGDATLIGDADAKTGNNSSDTGDATRTLAPPTEAGDDSSDADAADSAGSPLRILSTDLGTVAPSGLLLVTVDVSRGVALDSVTVGPRAITLTDPNVFRWIDQVDPAKSVFAIRMPVDLVPAPIDLRLHGASVQSDPYTITVVSPSTRGAPASAGIVFAPTKAADEPFPISSSAPFGQQDVQQPDPHFSDWAWVYILDFYDVGSRPDDAGHYGACAFRGTIAGSEHHCPAPADGGPNVTCGRSFACVGDICNPLTGTYALSTNANYVDLFIDRGAPDGPEHFVGGWIEADGSLPARASGVPLFLVLRSMRTGMLLTIGHSFGSMGCVVPASLDASAE